MSTPADWIKGALEDLGVVSSGETVSSGDQDIGRRKLNLLLDSWNTDGLLVYGYTRTTKLLTTSDGTYTVAAAGDIAITQPVFLERATLIPNGGTLEQEVRILSTQEWARWADKVTTGTPCELYFQKAANGTGTIYLFPIPALADTLVLYHPVQLTQVTVALLSTTYNLMPGYEAAIQAELALLLAPSFGKAGSPEVAILAEVAASRKGAIRRANLEPITAQMDPALQNYRWYDITTGGFTGSGGGGYGN